MAVFAVFEFFSSKCPSVNDHVGALMYLTTMAFTAYFFIKEETNILGSFLLKDYAWPLFM
jgi:hypothetical protein